MIPRAAVALFAHILVTTKKFDNIYACGCIVLYLKVVSYVFQLSPNKFTYSNLVWTCCAFLRALEKIVEISQNPPQNSLIKNL